MATPGSVVREVGDSKLVFSSITMTTYDGATEAMAGDGVSRLVHPVAVPKCLPRSSPSDLPPAIISGGAYDPRMFGESLRLSPDSSASTPMPGTPIFPKVSDQLQDYFKKRTLNFFKHYVIVCNYKRGTLLIDEATNKPIPKGGYYFVYINPVGLDPRTEAVLDKPTDPTVLILGRFGTEFSSNHRILDTLFKKGSPYSVNTVSRTQLGGEVFFNDEGEVVAHNLKSGTYYATWQNSNQTPFPPDKFVHYAAIEQLENYLKTTPRTSNNYLSVLMHNEEGASRNYLTSEGESFFERITRASTQEEQLKIAVAWIQTIDLSVDAMPETRGVGFK